MQYSPVALLLSLSVVLSGCDAPDSIKEGPLTAHKESASLESSSSASTAESQQESWYEMTEDSGSEVALMKSPADDRAYRYLTLENGLQVVLISDPDADKSAASLSIDVGSFENPKDRDGLAHFLEHMLFLGTDKFPEPGEYQAFLSEHGGSFNAYTSLEETNYFFDVDADYLLPTLDRFSRFFVAPMFNPEYVDRERHAVDSEYQLKIKDDSRREWDVLRELANPDHPFSQFSVGSLETLANPEDNPVREDLIAFYEKYYSADHMNLVVLGTQSLDELEKEISARFEEVPRHELTLPRTETPLFARDLPFKTYIKPEKELRSISFNFPLPSVQPHWQQKPLDFLGHLLGHEGEGTLIASLKERGLAEALSAGLVFDSRHGALFTVDIRLTPAGLASQDRISSEFFQWLALVKEKGMESWRYDEVATLREQAFQFSEESPPMNYVRQLSTSLHQTEADKLLAVPYYFDEFDAKVIGAYAGYLSPDNVAIVVISPEVETDRKTVLYDAPYKVEGLAENDLVAKTTDIVLSLPERNPYIADKLQLKNPQKDAFDNPQQVGEGLWFYPDAGFGTPRGYFEARIGLGGLNTVEASAKLDLLLALVNDELSAESYDAYLAGLNYSIAPWEQGYSITLTGYDDKQSALLDRILQVLQNPGWSQARFDRVKESLERSLRNKSKEWPLRQLFGRLPSLISTAWNPLEKADALADVDLKSLESFHQQVTSAASIRFYAGGNYAVKDAEKLASLVTEVVSSSKDGVSLDIVDLKAASPLPATYYYVDHSDSAALLYLQAEGDSLRDRALYSVLNKVASAPFYSSLRTDKQLGYAVGSSISHVQRVPGILFYVQSPKVDADALREEINQFLTGYEATLGDMEEVDIDRFKAAVLATIEEKPRNINEQASRHLESLNLGFEGFDFRNQLAAEVKAIDKAALVAAYKAAMLGSRPGVWVLTSKDESVGLGKPLDAAYIEGRFSYPQ